jgi:acetolactate synthase-1/2/3 large subunit
MLVGGGAVTSQAYEEILELATLLVIPVTTTIMGKGIIPETHPLSVGACGLLGGRLANRLIDESDLILVVGSRLTNFDTANYSHPRADQRIIHIDIDPNEIGKIYPTRVRMVGDAKLALQALLPIIKTKIQQKKNELEQMPRVNELAKLRKEWDDSMSPKMNSDNFPCTPHRIIKEIRAYLSKDDVLVCDASTASLWPALLYKIPQAGQYFIAPRGIAPIGYGYPASIGAQLAVPHKRVIAFCGDGGFGLSLTELDTAIRVDTPVIAVVHNNAALGWIKHVQKTQYAGRTISVDHRKELDYSKVAQAYGCFGRRIERPTEIFDALKEAEQSGKPAVIDIPEDPNELVPTLTFG